MNERLTELYRSCRSKEGLASQDEYKSANVLLGTEVAKFAELIVRECIAQCEQVAVDANATAKSTFVTDVGRILHEGMWGGATNCAGQIKQHFGVEQ